MVVVSIFRWLLNLCWKEKMKIYRYEADTAFSKTLAADYQGAVSIRKTVLPGMAIPMLKIRRPNGRLIFNMEIPIRR